MGEGWQYWRTVYCPSVGNSAIAESPKHSTLLSPQRSTRPLPLLIGRREVISQGKAHLILDVHKLDNFQAGEVLDGKTGLGTDYEKASAIVTQPRAYLPCGNYCTGDWCSSDRCSNATDVLKTGQEVTISCAEGEEGRVYAGLPHEVRESCRWRTCPALAPKFS